MCLFIYQLEICSVIVHVHLIFLFEPLSNRDQPRGYRIITTGVTQAAWWMPMGKFLQTPGSGGNRVGAKRRM